MISTAFSGSKIALFNDTKILIYRRDNKPNIPFPGLWDLPGGGRDGEETPEECVCREVLEEFGISIPAHQISWSKSYSGSTPDSLAQFFFAGQLTDDDVRAIQFGDEGETWMLIDVAAYLQLSDAIRSLQHRVLEYLHGRDDCRSSLRTGSRR